MVSGRLSRRETLCLSSVALVGLVGCSEISSDQTPTASPTKETKEPPEATGANVTVSYGETTTVTVTASNVDRLSVAAPSTEAIDLIAYGQATIDPSPDIQLDSLPPIWTWDTPEREVSVTLPISAPDDFEPGTYQFTVEASGSQEDQTAEAPLVIRVRSNATTEE
jgi:ABC-type Fe3+-hydroxamate transport system substrate-binding protein